MEFRDLHNKPGVKSIWRSYSSGSDFPVLDTDITTDVVVIGGGITGITCAQLLKQQGYNVVVLEALKVGGGSTGHSTGNLYVATEQGFDAIQSKYDTEALKTVITARQEALNTVKNTVYQLGIDCDFEPRSWYLFAADENHGGKIDDVYEAGMAAGADIHKIAAGEIPFKHVNGVKMDNQAQFNPLRYVQQLAKNINADDCRIFEDSRVDEIEENDDTVKVITAQGSVTAKFAIHATHTPKGFMPVYQSLLGPYREYGVAVKLGSGAYPQGTFWGYYGNQRFSVRSYNHDGERYLLAVGQPHKVGQHEDNEENIVNLEKFLKERFDVDEVTNRWGGQNYKPADGLPYIGRKSDSSNQFIATGFSTDGLIWGVVSAKVICDMIMDKETECTKLFHATRHNPVKAAGKFVEENLNNAGQILKDYLLPKSKDMDGIAVEEGKVMEVNGKKLAVYHDITGEMKACSAICPHMGCVVHWNNVEKTWDCPCHASRFTTDGCIIEGPTLKPLQKVTLTD
ncbi:FAD-dependent oxidoreductase [Flavobacterium coralii]|uniref:FAD-dependent oxidoreductase n=1 Tax=Flavobacterium coralii TaxID=2838017 RepID=UPI000C63819C|nr:(2Fe-2S)-binding protein [Flavobacterium sp.]